MTDEKRPADRVVELFLFAPVGLALSVRELLPDLVERGRQQLGNQVTMARMLGEFAVKQGQGEAEKAFERAREQAQATLENLGVGGDGQDRTPPSAPTSEPVARTAPAPAKGATTAPSPEPVPVSGPGAPAPVATVIDLQRQVPELAIPDYDSLSASQVLPRLSGLDTDDLEAVRAHEASNRGRKTILSKIAQLQGA